MKFRTATDFWSIFFVFASNLLIMKKKQFKNIWFNFIFFKWKNFASVFHWSNFWSEHVSLFNFYQFWFFMKSSDFSRHIYYCHISLSFRNLIKKFNLSSFIYKMTNDVVFCLTARMSLTKSFGDDSWACAGTWRWCRFRFGFCFFKQSSLEIKSERTDTDGLDGTAETELPVGRK